jgi:hypothetical protein
MPHPEDDVALADGCAFMVETGPYSKHLSNSMENKQACRLGFFRDLATYKCSDRNLLAITIGQ